MLVRRNRSNLSAENVFYLTKTHGKGSSCAKESGVRQPTVPSGLLFDFPQEELSPPQIEKRAGKSAARSRFPDENFPE